MYPKFNKNLNAYEIDVFSLDKRRAEPPFWAGGPQPQDPAPWANLGTFAAGVGLTAGFGAMPIGRGRRGVDVYYNIAKKVEDFSPGKILRTFAVSDLLFPFTKEAGFSARGMQVPVGGKLAPALEAVYGQDRLSRFVIDPKTGLKRVVTVADEVANNLKNNTLFAEFLFDNKKILGTQLSPQTQRLIAISRAYASSQVQRFNSLLDELERMSKLFSQYILLVSFMVLLLISFLCFFQLFFSLMIFFSLLMLILFLLVSFFSISSLFLFFFNILRLKL